MTMFCNSFIAVFYCFEQWLEGMAVSPNWRGVLLASMFAMVLLFRPLASVLLLRRGKLPAMAVSIAISSGVMLGYSYVGGPHAIGMIWTLRIVQGIALAVFSSCTVAVLVSCIPKGQSARGFAIFSLTMLLPFAWMISTSFKHANLVYTIPPQWIPNPVDWDNYSELWSASNVVTGLLNSTIISLTVLTLSTFTSTMAAFSFAKLRFPGKQIIF